MPPKKRVRDDPEAEDDHAVVASESTKKKARGTTGVKTPATKRVPTSKKTPSVSTTPAAKKTKVSKATPAAKANEALSDDMSPELQERLLTSTRKSVPSASKNSRITRPRESNAERSQNKSVKKQPAAAPAKRTPARAARSGTAQQEQHREQMTPPSPELLVHSSPPRTDDGSGTGGGRRSSLDGRFAMVDDSNPSRSSTGPLDVATSSPMRKHTYSDSSRWPVAFARDVTDDAQSSACTRLLLPILCLLAALALLLVTTGTAPLGEYGEERGFGRPMRPGAALVTNVTAHMRAHLAPLGTTLEANAKVLQGENAELDLLTKKVDMLEADKAAVKQRLADAINKVDRLLAADPPTDPRALSDYVEEATVSMQRLKMDASALESAVRGHLEDIAKVLVNSPSSSASSSEAKATKEFFSKWVERAYQEYKPKPSPGFPELVSKASAAELISEYVATFAEAECAGLHDFANLKNGARVQKASATYGDPSSTTSAPMRAMSAILHPFRGGLPPAGTKPPEAALTTGNELGECWPMEGSSGRLVVELANLVRLKSVTLMHIHPKLAPKGGDVSSAPHHFKVFAYPEPVLVEEDEVTSAKEKAAAAKADVEAVTKKKPLPSAPSGPKKSKLVYPDKVEVASGAFDKNAGCMTFPLTASPEITSADSLDAGVRFVELEVLSNHGREELTCLYRFMVHGDPVHTPASS